MWEDLMWREKSCGEMDLCQVLCMRGEVLWRSGNVLSSPHETEFKNKLSVSSCGKSKVNRYVE
jgi:hypothetical protein